MTNDLENRRPLKVRSASWARAAAARLAHANVSPDAISCAGVACAVLGGSLMMLAGGLGPAGRAVALILAVLCIQLRLVCNLLDGLVAVEHGKASPAGPIWNELPDRVADVLFLVGAGYFARTAGLHGAEALGWLAAVLAVVTAYVRELGRGLGQPADFRGPMAKPQRMAALTVACLISVVELLWRGNGQIMVAALAIIVVGTLITVVRRTRHLAIRLSDNIQSEDEDQH
ncbi:CDP-alcohol phosphatidyltransferase family protein [Caulobacter sp. DWR1-3-2b1]|uniref:CDP-alcohol phosphatidyltransferase family protein n=1 Tax=Caulobacter sp. DWR1-3-2b1 TaxID=2804670 RepID=UPI003CEF45B7